MDVVYNLINVKRFDKYTYEEKLELKKQGRPMPDINIEVSGVSRGRTYKRRCNRVVIYSKNDWICACNRKNALFCFPCLLYGGETLWTETGVTGLMHLSERMKTHERSRRHITNAMELALLGSGGLISQLDSNSEHQTSEDMIKQKYVLSKILDSIKACTAFDLSLRGLDKASTSQYSGLYQGLINFSSALDGVITGQLKNTSVLRGTPRDIQNDILDCILEVCQEEIIKEINKAMFLAIIVDDTTDVSEVQQLAVVFRYTRNDKPVERFWKYISHAKFDARSVTAEILKDLDPLLESNTFKLISQSYNGTVILSDRMTGVQALIKEKYLTAHFMHCYAHDVNMVLSKVTSENTQLRIFFGKLQEFSAFFGMSPEYLEVLNTIVKRNQPNSGEINVNFNSDLISVLYENRHSFIECMEEIVEQYSHEKVCSTACAIRRILQDTDFIFWLNFFYEVVPSVDFLFQQMEDLAKSEHAIKVFNNTIDIVITTIDEIIDRATEMRKDLLEVKRRKLSDHTAEYKAAALKVCNDLSCAMEGRFANKNYLLAASFLPPKNFLYLNNFMYLHKLPEEELTSLFSAYPVLDKSLLRTELNVLYSKEDFTKLEGALQVLKFLVRHNLEGTFKETRKLVDIVLTTPMLTSESERCFTTAKRIRTFLENTLHQERLTALSMLAIEKKFISQMYNFNEKVVDKYFARTQCKIPFESNESRR